MAKEPKVKVILPKAREGEEKELFVGVNGVGYRIQKRKEVEVPASVAEVIRNSYAADDELDAFLGENAPRSPE